MRGFFDWFLVYRAAAPADDDERRQLAVRLGAVLFFLGGALGLSVVPMAAAANVHDYHPIGIVIPCAIAVITPIPAYLFRARLSWTIIVGQLLVGTAFISIGQYSATGQLPHGAALYILLATYGLLFLTRRQAVLLIAMIGVEYAVLLSVGRHFVAPVVQWLFLMVVLAVTGLVVDWLVRRTRALVETEHDARTQLEDAQAELGEWNRTLEQRVMEQLDQLQGMGELRRFLSPQVADAVIQSVSAGNENLLEPHRRLISVYFCDLRGFTRFSGHAEPEDVMAVLDEYYATLGALMTEFDATVGVFAGDGMMAYFNDPVPCDDPAMRAVELAVATREAVDRLAAGWVKRGVELGFGVGVALGYATLGPIGFESRRDYGPLGTVVNLASRLCDEAASGEILADARCYSAVADAVDAHERSGLWLKGFADPITAFAVDAVRVSSRTASEQVLPASSLEMRSADPDRS